MGTVFLHKLNTIAGFLMVGMALANPAVAATASSYRQMGLSYRQQERYPEAIAAFRKAAELDPQNLDGRVLLGWTLHRAGQRADAAEELVETLYLNPFYVPTLNALGIVYLVEGKLTAAVLTHNWAGLLKADNEIAAYNLSLAYHRLQQYPTAIVQATRAAELEPSNPHPLVALAIAQWDKGDRAAAQQTFRQAVNLDGRYGDSSFLTYLNEAGFSPDQIQKAKQILAATTRTSGSL